MLQLMRTTPMRLRILISVVIGVASAVFCWAVLTRLHQGAADFTWAIRAAQHLLAGKNPYDTPLEQYPLTAALFGCLSFGCVLRSQRPCFMESVPRCWHSG